MSIHSRFIPLIFVPLAMALSSCSDDGGPGEGEADTTPPAVTSVTAADAGHIAVKFSEAVHRGSAENLPYYLVTESVVAYAPASPGDTLRLDSASLLSDQRTVLITTYSAMDVVGYDFSVKGVKDLAGNSILTPITTSFTGTNAADTTPPQLVYRSPGPNATGVAVSMPLGLQFSEAVTYDSILNGFAWTSGTGPVAFDVTSPDDGIHVSVVQREPLHTATMYTVTLDSIADYSGNIMAAVTWSFTTTSTVDNTPPTVVSTSPADGATHVSIHAALSITFSEPINQIEVYIQVIPEIGDGDMVWSNGGKTLTFTPDFPLAADQQYVVSVPPGGVRDLVGNQSTELYVTRFTTGNALATGHIAGTVSGDPLSDNAKDPAGAYVIAATASPMDTDNFGFGAIDILAGSAYNLSNLADDTYYPFAILNSNGDGIIDPSAGDAIGMYGIDIRAGDMEADSVIIAGGNHVAGVDFPLFDPSAITGTVTYSGVYASGFYSVGVGLFDADNFDPTGEPLFATGNYWPEYPDFWMHTLDGIPDGRYYLGAFLDVNYNGTYEPDADPAGLYGGITPTLITFEKGHDFLNLVIPMQDPAGPGSARVAVAWPKAPAERPLGLERLRTIAAQAGRMVSSSQ